MPITERVAADLPVTIKTQNYSLLPDDFGQEIQFENTTALTANLLPVAIAGNGYNTIIRNVGPSTLTIQPSIGENIDGASSASVAVGAWQWIRSDGTEWKSVSQDGMGTGSVTLSDMASGTAGNLISYDASGDPVAVAAGSSGEVLTSNGAGATPTFQPISGSGGLQSMQVITSTGTWTKPAGITKIKVTVVGGGGGGGGCASTASTTCRSGGGGAGGNAIKFIDVSMTSSEAVTIGAGGPGGNTSGSNGSSGNTTSFGAHCSATGGAPGQGDSVGNVRKEGGAAGSGTGGDINNNGSAGTYSSFQNAMPGMGGSSLLSGGAAAVDVAGTGAVGLNGSGGAGVRADNVAVGQIGGAGGNGIIIVEEYS